MKRNIIVGKLVNEGFSEKTLANFTDKQLNDLAERMLGEQVTTVPGKPSFKVGDKGGSLPPSPKGYQITKDPVDKTTIAQPMESDVKEELKGGQKKLDKNHNGKIDGQDFKILKGQKEKKEEVNEVDMGLTVKVPKSSGTSVFGASPKKSSSSKKKTTPTKKKEEDGNEQEGDMDESLHGILLGAIKDKLTKELGRDPENHEIDKAHGDFIDTLKKEDEPKEEKEKDVEEGDYHNERSEKALEKSKEEFPQLKNIKKCEECGKVESKCKCTKEDVKEVKNWVNNLIENKKFHSFTSKNEIMELIQTKINESETMTQHGSNVKKGHNGIPEFMSYDSIKSAGPATKPTTKPTTKPGTKPKTPYSPGPKPNPKPKASFE